MFIPVLSSLILKSAGYKKEDKVTTKYTKCPVHTIPEKFENAALFLQLGLLSTLIRHENWAF